jgi:hypothetical protein
LTSLSEREIVGTSRFPAIVAVPNVALALAAVVPPPPVHSSVKVVDAVSRPELSDPDTSIAPLQPPDAWHESALVLDQVSVVVPPVATSDGCAWSDTVGAGVLPPPPPPQAASKAAITAITILGA